VLHGKQVESVYGQEHQSNPEEIFQPLHRLFVSVRLSCLIQAAYVELWRTRFTNKTQHLRSNLL
jgi:hypothetical protein